MPNNEKTVKGKFTSLADMNNEPTKEDTNSLVTYNFTAVLTKRYLLAILVELLIPRNEIHLPLRAW